MKWWQVLLMIVAALGVGAAAVYIGIAYEFGQAFIRTH